MRVVPNGVDCEKWTPADANDRAAARSRLGLSDQPRAGCVGRLCEQKGQRDLIEAWATVRRAVADAELVLVGDGPDRAALQAQLRDWRDVVLIGEYDDVMPWLVASDVVVAPSRWEGMALVPLEAMACARSVVVTDVAGMAESVPTSAGAVGPVGDYDRLAREIVVRLTDTERAAAEGAAGRRHVEAHHGAAAAASAVVSLYSTLLRRRSSGRQAGR
jgi:glycosyltransferase involved in cell wall biosynthesis